MPTLLSLLLIALLTYFSAQKLIKVRKYKKAGAFVAALAVAWAASALPDIVDNTHQVFLQYQKNTPEKRSAIEQDYKTWFESNGLSVQCEISGAAFEEITFASKSFTTPAVNELLDTSAFIDKLSQSGFKKVIFTDDLATKDRLWYLRLVRKPG